MTLTALLALTMGSAVVGIVLLVIALVTAALARALAPPGDAADPIPLTRPRIAAATSAGLCVLGVVAWAGLGTTWGQPAEPGSLSSSLPNAALVALAIALVVLLTAVLGMVMAGGQTAAATRRRTPAVNRGARPEARPRPRRSSSGRR